jgi:hypothetical protein
MPDNSFSNTKLFIISCILGGILIALFDMDQTEVQPAVLMILIFTGVAGFLRPTLAYIWALILGLSIFAVDFIAIYTGHTFTHPPQPNVYATLVALIPAFIGAYAGVLLHWLNSKINKKVNKSKL